MAPNVATPVSARFRRVLESEFTWIALIVLTVTVPLIYWSLTPIRLVVVVIQPDRDGGEPRLRSRLVLTTSNGTSAYVDFTCESSDPALKALTVLLRSSGDREFHPAGTLEARGGLLRGVVQLGRSERPLSDHEVYTFRLADGTGNVLMDGTILPRGTTVAGRDQALVLTVGILASVIQILEAVARWVLGQIRRPPPDFGPRT